MALREHPAGSGRYDPARDCGGGHAWSPKSASSPPILADPSASARQRATALKFLVHLVGDLYQPLHRPDHGDRGGNELGRRLSGNRSNLHHVWDSELVRDTAGLDAASFGADWTTP